MEIKVPNIQVERIERQINTDFMGRESHAKTYRGHLIGCIQKCRNDGNFELLKLYEEELRVFNGFYPQKLIRVEILQGYKDYDKIIPNIYKDIENNVLIRVWHKDNYEDRVIEKCHINAFKGILGHFSVGESVSCYRIAKMMGYGQTEREAWQELWKRRMTDYFPKYYFVCLFLEKIGVIDYGKKGVITRLK